MKTTAPEILLPHRATLGEGPVWDVYHRSFLWVDIMGKALHEYIPHLGQHQVRDLPQMPGAAALLPNGDFLLALQNGLAFMDRQTGALEPLADPEAGKPNNRFNDGKCDPQGRFWAGTMSLDETPEAGSLYRLDTDRSLHHMVGGVSISNGLAWNEAADTLYYIDTPLCAVTAFDYNPGTGEITNRREAFAIDPGEGYPDGMCIDREGMLWIAHWGGWQVARWNPHTGKKLAEIRLPAAHITSCCFGGETLSDLYITSARAGLSDSELMDQPEAGAVFVVRNCAPGGWAPDRFGESPGQ
ncbi:SMP-30/gluconolactonase/LRE family protein [Robiginitalea sediminis]|uniref:SMP-30/gluconolactonase/LRE family protein n=1 Tax=Robiginitalea sediminis TaxID=1982593 RepID=UPI000B4A5DC4|nr:SMP-30/gluconolactonase/LRE family protein [Robiginitalea sediminis]